MDNSSYFYPLKFVLKTDFFTCFPFINRKTGHMILNKTRISLLALAAMIMVVVSACGKKTDTPAKTPTVPTLTTAGISLLGQTTATCGGYITSNGGAAVTGRGVCWSRNLLPVITDAHTSDGPGTGLFTSMITGLTANTLYYARAYATNSAGTAYGNSQPFTTLKIIVDSVTDVDGNHYHVVLIGGQSWLRENLRVKHYRNGDAIPAVTVDNLWKNLTTGALCAYDNLESNVPAYGYLYNWYALTDARGLCPAGYHVPADGEWAVLGTQLGGDTIAGGKLKSTGTIEQSTGLWYAPNTGATNSSGFSGLPAGYRINYGTFYSMVQWSEWILW